MRDPIYTAEARVTGGRQHGHGRTTDGELDVQIRPPKELGGEGGGTNPEQLFAVGYAACFESAMTHTALRLKLPAEQVADLAIVSKVMLIPTAERGFALGVELAVEVPSLEDHEQAAALVRAAHKVCPYSNATRGNVEVALSINGVPLDQADT